jgi:hypothetical protein
MQTVRFTRRARQEVMSPGFREDFSRKGAKAQSAAAFLNGFLCAFAPLREKSSLVRFQTGQVTERAEAGKEKVGAAFDSHKSLQVVNARA